MLLKELLAREYAPLKGISPRTQRLYAMTFDAWSRSLGREPDTEDLNELEVAKFLQVRKTTKAAATAAKDRAQVRAIWEFAARRKIVDQFPLISTIKVPKRVPEAWLTDEVVAILRACETEHGAICNVPASLWFRAIVHVLYETGERISAIMALEWQDVRGNRILFRAETRKGGREDMNQKISATCLEALAAIAKPARVMVFPWDRHHTYLWWRFGKIVERAGLPGGRRSKFHRLRRTSASYLAAAGGDPQKHLGHSSPTMTKLYLDPRITESGPQACDLIPRVG